MTICLSECLRAAGLQHHYARFTSVGVCHAAHLSALRMEDYPLLGISSMEDRSRLFHLVQMLKTLDLKNFTNDDVRIHNDKYYDGGDEDYAAADGRFSSDGNLDEDVSEYQNEKKAFSASRVRRRLEFTSESSPVRIYASSNKKDEPVEGRGSATSIGFKLLSRNPVLSGHHEMKNHKQYTCSCDHPNDKNLKPHISKTSHTSNSSSAAVTSKTFKHLNRSRISGRKADATDLTEPKPVYEAQRTAGYNYGLPLSSPHTPNRKHVGGQRISVCVRKRPLTAAEFRRREEDVVTTPGGDCVIVHESKEAVDLTEYILQHRFYFDQVFGEERSNEEVYQKTAYPLVQHMLSGGKATCFAYGQTGAGKTHTMLGLSPEAPGLYALAVRDIFAHLSTTHTRSSLLVYVSFFEIYCGQLYDLLDNRKRLFAREDGQKVVHISGLRNVRVDSVNSLLKVISLGTAGRTQGMSGVNPLSSRSHALLQIQLRDPNQQAAGRMWFVDLAGSERASDAKEPNRQTRMEGAEINQSLLALKECIRSLDKEESHTPFRQSKLTQVLKDSFVGDSLTCMIANISPGHQATEHTLNTLRYADRVKELKGQGELRGRRRCTMGPSFTHNMSNSNNKSRSNDVTLKKTKLAKQSETFGPATRSPSESRFLCSTPKNIRCGGEMQSRGRKEIGFKHVTPVRGFLANDNRASRSKWAGEGEGRRIEKEKCRSCDSHYVREESTRAELLLRQQTGELQNKEQAPEGNLAKGESRFHLRQKENHQNIVTVRREEETEWMETRRREENYRVRSRKVKRQTDRDLHDKEKMRHLRQYHQQLQQFIPSSTSSSVNLPSLLHASQLLFLTHMDHSLEENSDSAGVEVDRDRGEMALVSDETHEQSETSTNYCMRREDRMPAGKERRQAWLEEAAMESKNRMTSAARTNKEVRPHCSCDSENRREMSVMGLNASDDPDNGVWSCDQREAAHYYSLESAHSTHDSTPFKSQRQQAPAERPLSPTREHNNVLLTSHNLNESPLESKHAKCNRNIFILPLLRTPEAVPSNTHGEKTTCFVATNTRPFSHVQSTASPAMAMSVLSQDEAYMDSFSYAMDPLSISLLHADQQAAAASFIQGGNRDTSLHQSGSDNGEKKKRETEGESLSGVEKAEKFVENGRTEFSPFLLKLPHAKIFHPVSSATSDTVTVTEQQEYTKGNVSGGGANKPCIPGFTLPSLQDGNNQDNRPHFDDDASAPSTCASVQIPLTSPAIQRIENVNSPKEYVHNELKKSSITTQQSENVSGHLTTIHLDHSGKSKVFPKPLPRGQESSSSNQQMRPTIHVFTRHRLDHFKWCIVEAHLEQLREMEALCHKEGKLLWQQHDMAFGDYVHKLAGILERKARCVHSMRAQLQPYLTFIQSNSSSARGDDHHSPVN